MQFEQLFLKIRKEKFYFLKFILEAYDGLALLSSSKIQKDIVVVRYPVENRREVCKLLSSISPQLSPFLGS